MADFAAGLIVMVATFGLLILLFGCLVGIEANTSGPQSAGAAASTLTAADLWMRKVQIWLNMAPARLLGSYAITLGLKMLAVTLIAAVPLDMMYSGRVSGERGRR